MTTTTTSALRMTAARLPRSGLLALTCIASLDGTMVMLAATGALSSWPGAIVAGLTAIAGAGSWLAARHEFSGRRLGRQDLALLAAIALVATAVALLAAAVGARLASAAGDLVVVPRVAGIVLLLLALDIGGIRVPRLARVPLAPLVLALGIAAEVALRWIP